MSLETITNAWRPSKKTSNTLKSDKYGYTQEQVNNLGKQFIQRHLNKQIPNASHQFFEFVRTSGVGHNMPKPSREADIQQAKQREGNFKNKSKDSAEKAAEVCEGINNPNQLKEETMRVIKAKWPDTDWTESFKRMGLTK